MIRKQRFYSALAHTAVDNLPIQLDISEQAFNQLAMEWNIPQTEASAIAHLHHHLVFARIKSLPGSFDSNINGQTDPWGVRWASDREGVWVVEHPLAKHQDLNKYRPHDIVQSISWEDIKHTVQHYSEDYIVVAYQNALLFERAWSLVGFERLLVEMYDDPRGVEALLDTITEIQCAIAQRFVDAGIQAARTGDDWGSQKGMLFSPRGWRQLIKPRLKKIWQVYQSNGIPIIHHSCGDIMDIVGDLVDMGLDMLNPLQPEAMNLEELAKQYGQQLSFYGGISVQKDLPYGTPDDVSSAVKHCVETLGRFGGYMIAPSQSITSDVPSENIRALLDAMLAYCR